MEPKLHRQLRQKYDDAEKQYLEKFGEDSLDRVFFGSQTFTLMSGKRFYQMQHWN